MQRPALTVTAIGPGKSALDTPKTVPSRPSHWAGTQHICAWDPTASELYT
jgi:hypothetical protein